MPRLPKSAGAREHKLGATARSFAILEHVASSRTPVDVLDIISSAEIAQGDGLPAGRLVHDAGISSRVSPAGAG